MKDNSISFRIKNNLKNTKFYSISFRDTKSALRKKEKANSLDNIIRRKLTVTAQNCH